MTTLNFRIAPIKIFIGLTIFITILLILNFLTIYFTLTIEDLRRIHRFTIREFNFNLEGNIPAFFSAVQLLVTSLIIFVIAFAEKSLNQQYLGWMGLALVFSFLAIDEAVMIHETLIGYFKDTYDLSGYFYYAWVIPYAIGVLVLFLVYIPFFLRLDLRMFGLMILAGFIFVSGAIGFEMLGGNEMENRGWTLTYMIYYSIEEFLEMIGVSIFVYSLLWFISVHYGKATFEFDNEHSNDVKNRKSRTVKDAFFP
ncbi:MAG TPA: hypothetical protein VK957_20250 [Lunatimonas sp.]|nr:hypothetical protein [Lunatimonas sp.]